MGNQHENCLKSIVINQIFLAKLIKNFLLISFYFKMPSITYLRVNGTRIIKSITIILVVATVALCTANLLLVKPSYGQAVSTPTLEISTASGSYVIPTKYSINPYTGANVTNLGEIVDSFNITLTFENSPTAQFYDVQYKGHYTSQWSNIYLGQYNVTTFASYGTQTSVTFYCNNTTPLGQSPANWLNVYYSGTLYPITLPLGGQLDFRVQAINGTVGLAGLGGYIIIGNMSAFSAVQTVTIPKSFSVSPSSTSIPELSAIAVIPLVVSISAALIERKRRSRKE